MAAIMKTYLQTVVNVTAATARLIIDQGLDDFDELDGFSEDDMKTLCYTIRRPGGTIPNPRARTSGQPHKRPWKCSLNGCRKATYIDCLCSNASNSNLSSN